MGKALLTIKELKKHFPITKGFFARTVASVKAVDSVSFEIQRGETLGIVGESGCGKSTLVNVLLNLIEPTAGQVIFDDTDVFACSKEQMRKLRQHMQIVFQDPYWSLNPRWLVKDIIAEPIRVHALAHGKAISERVEALLVQVGLTKAALYKYPHEFSGGQRQRIAIARALALTPSLLVLDEPTSSIDIFSQQRILELLNKLRREFQLTYILISHDLGVVNRMSDNIVVMYLGKLVEYGTADQIFHHPAHPYTQALLQALPRIGMQSIDELSHLKGNIPSAINPPAGCYFNTRCPQAMDICREFEPPTVGLETPHWALCHLLA